MAHPMGDSKRDEHRVDFDCQPPKMIILDMASSVSPTHGEQEGTMCNGHFCCTCCHPLFLLNQFGNLERCSLRPNIVHRADSWCNVMEPVVGRYRERNLRRYFRGDSAFILLNIYEFLEGEGLFYVIRLQKNQILQESIVADLAYDWLRIGGYLENVG